MGECAPECTACGQVCPTQAIQPFSAEEKAWLYIGTAVIDRSLCLVWSAQKQCLVCDEVCTYRAIEWKVIDGVAYPIVNDQICVGCGLCEARCPVQPQAAIRVYSFGDKRSWSREKQKRWRQMAKRKGATWEELNLQQKTTANGEWFFSEGQCYSAAEKFWRLTTVISNPAL
jgi:ferredoxin